MVSREHQEQDLRSVELTLLEKEIIKISLITYEVKFKLLVVIMNAKYESNMDES